MGFMIKNMVLETAAAPGSSVTVNLAGTTAPFQTFASSYSTGDIVYQMIQNSSQWEISYGAFTAGSPNTISRSTIVANSDHNTSLINFVGTVTCYPTIPAERAIYINNLGVADLLGYALDGVASVNTGQLAGRRNALHNGDFAIWQRGTSISTPVTGAGTADRWALDYDGTGSTFTVARQAATDATLLDAGAVYGLRYNRTVAGSGGTYLELRQRVENVNTLAGQSVTLSCWAKADASRTLNAFLRQNFGSGGSGAVTTSTQAFALTTSWQQFSATWTLGSMSGKTIGTSSYLQAALQLPLNVTETIDLALMQLEIGGRRTPFERVSLGAELMECQRHFQKAGSGASGYALFADHPDLYGSFSTPMRAAPTLSLVSTAPTLVSAGSAFTGSASAIDVQGSTVSGFRAYLSGFSGLTVGATCHSLNEFLYASAEL